MSHRWNISDTSCEGFYAGKPARVWRARCMNEGCHATAVFPVHPEEFKGVQVPPVPECKGKQVPVRASAPQDVRLVNFEGKRRNYVFTTADKVKKEKEDLLSPRGGCYNLLSILRRNRICERLPHHSSEESYKNGGGL